MARIFTEGWELGANLWDTPSTFTVTSSTVRTGAYALDFQYSSTMWTTLPGEYIELYVRVAGYRTSYAGSYYGIFSLGYATGGSYYPHANLWWNGTSVYICHGDWNEVTYVCSPKMAYTGKWHVFEFHYILDNSSGLAELRVNGQDGGYYSGNTNTSNPSYTAINAVGIRGNSSYAGRIDDIAINDTTGSYNNSWVEDGRIVSLTPNGNGDSSQWVGSDADSTDNYLLVDEVPVNTSDYVDEDTSGEKDLYAVSDWAVGTVLGIHQVYLDAYAQNPSGSSVMELGIKTGGSEYWETVPVMSTSWVKRTTVSGWPINPQTTSAWTTTDLDSVQIGQRMQS